MNIFITGASGYIGGSLCEYLQDIGHHVTDLVRSQENAAALQQRGITALVGQLEENDVISRGVRASDIVINTAEADDVDRLKPLMEALAGTGKTLVHTGGSSVIVDDAQGQTASDAIFSDDTPFNPMPHRVPRVTVDRMVRSAAIHSGIRASVISPSMVYGEGRGLKSDSHQVPLLRAKSLERGKGLYIGRGAPIWSTVYLGDLLSLYALAMEKAPGGSFFFAADQELSFYEIATAFSESLGFDGQVASWDLEEANLEVGKVAQVALATNCRARAINAQTVLGWQPQGPSLREALLKRL